MERKYLENLNKKEKESVMRIIYTNNFDHGHVNISKALEYFLEFYRVQGKSPFMRLIRVLKK